MSALPDARSAMRILGGALALLAVTATTSLGATTVRPAADASTDPDGGYFVVQARPGDSLTDTLLIDNPDDAPVSLALAVVGSQTGEFGGVVYRLPDEPADGSATWVTLETDAVTVDAESRARVSFRVDVPEDATPGTHLAGLSVSPAEPDEAVTTLDDGPVSAGVQLRSRRVIALQVDVAGPREPALAGSDAVAAVKPQGVYARVILTNPGTDLLRPTGTFTLSDPSGTTLIEEPFELGTVVPGTDVEMAFAWSQEPPAPGTYPVTVTATDASGATLDWNDTIVIDGEVAAAAADRVVSDTPAPTAPGAGPDPILVALLAGLIGAVVVALVGGALLLVGGSRRRERALRDELARRSAFGPHGQPGPHGPYGPPPAGPWQPGPHDRPDAWR